MELICFEFVDAGQNIGIPIDGIDTIALASGNEGKVNSDCFRALVGPGKQTILSHENPAFDSPFRLVVIDSDVRISEEPGQSDPMLQCICDCLHQLVCGMKVLLRTHNDFAEALDERLGLSPSHAESKERGFVYYVPFNFVQFPVYVEHSVANFFFAEFCIEVFSSGVSVATGFSSFAVFEELIETAGCISLDDTFEVFEKLQIPVERQIRRIVKDDDVTIGVTDVGGNLALANVVFVLAVLNFDGRVVGFDDVRLEQFFFEQVVQQGKCVGCVLHPIALSGAWNHDILPRKNFLLTIVGKSIIEFAYNDFAQEAWSCITARDRETWFIGSDDVLFATGARPSLLAMLQDLQACADHLELVREDIADEYCFDVAFRANRVFRSDWIWHRFVWQIDGVVEDVLDAGGSLIVCSGACFCRSCGGRAWVTLFCLFPVVTPRTFFRLSDQDIEFGLQVLEQLALFLVAIESLFQPTLQIFDERGEALNFRPGVGEIILESREVVFHVPPGLVS